MTRAVVPDIPGVGNLRPLGAGGMGEVYRGEDATGRQVAVKISRGLPAAGLERFRREAELLGRFQSEAVVRAHSWGTVGDVAYLVCELIDGEPLDRAAEACRDVPARLALLRRVVQTVEVAHREGVVHRDLKPSNVLVQPSGEVKLIDFGVSIGLDQDRLTRTGAFVGTPLYMAPEQFERRTPSPAADVWSLGVLGYELVSGRVPFDGENLLALTASWSRRPESIRDHVSRGVERVILRALEPDPSRRYPDARALGEALDQAIEGTAPSRSPARLVLLGAALLGSGAVAAGVASSPPASSEPERSVSATPSPSEVPVASATAAPAPSAERPRWPLKWTGRLTTEEQERLRFLTGAKAHENLPLIKALAERGEPKAARLYGLALVVGDSHGVKRDYPAGFAYLCRAVQYGSVRAAGNLAPLFVEGERLPEQWRVYGFEDHRAAIQAKENLPLALALAYLGAQHPSKRANRMAREMFRFLTERMGLPAPASPAAAYAIVQRGLEEDPATRRILSRYR